jgi:hypothetical protein
MRDEPEPETPPPDESGGVEVGVGGIIGTGNVEVETGEDKAE